MNTEFERDMSRYMVIKVSDANAALGEEDKAKLTGVLLRVAAYRVQQGKAPLSCVVVESDWPVYQAVWDLVEEQACLDATNCTDSDLVEATRRVMHKAADRARLPLPSARGLLDDYEYRQKYLNLIQTVFHQRRMLKYARDVLGTLGEATTSAEDRGYCAKAVEDLEKANNKMTHLWGSAPPMTTKGVGSLVPEPKTAALTEVVAFFEHRADVLGGLSEEAEELLAKVKAALA